MKRALLVVSLGLAGLCVAMLAVLVVPAPAPLQAPDPSLPIRFAAGSELPLSEVLDRATRGAPLPRALGAPPVAAAPAANTGTPLPADAAVVARESTLTEAELQELAARAHASAVACYGPIFVLADEALQRGELDQAQALFQSLPESHPQYARAQRRIAWDIMTRERGQPGRGIAQAQIALRAEPLSSNAWQDAARVYGSALGFEMR